MDPGQTEDKAWHSGSRLRARVIDAGDGAAMFVAWHDHVTGEECSFAVTEDGATRCIPEWTQALYEDSACSEPVVVPANVPCGSTPREWYSINATEPTGDNCAPPVNMRVVHATGPTASVAFFSRQNGACELYDVGTAEPVRVEPVTPSRFVGSHERAGASAGRLATVIREGDDGSSEVARVVDTERSEPCEAQPSRTGKQACLPVPDQEHVAYRNGYHFSDSACTVPVAESVSCVEPEIILSDDPRDCSDSRVAALGDALAGPTYTSVSGSCQQEPLRAGMTYYRVGADVFGDFASLEDVFSGSGRIRSRRWGENGIGLSPATFLTDTESGKDCVLWRGDTLRCAPSDSGIAVDSGVFADSACTVPLLTWSNWFESCDPPLPRPELGVFRAGACGAPRYVTLGPDFTGDRFEPGSDGTCQPLSASTVYDHLATAGDPIDPSTFPRLVDRVE